MILISAFCIFIIYKLLEKYGEEKYYYIPYLLGAVTFLGFIIGDMAGVEKKIIFQETIFSHIAASIIYSLMAIKFLYKKSCSADLIKGFLVLCSLSLITENFFIVLMIILTLIDIYERSRHSNRLIKSKDIVIVFITSIYLLLREKFQLDSEIEFYLFTGILYLIIFVEIFRFNFTKLLMIIVLLNIFEDLHYKTFEIYIYFVSLLYFVKITYTKFESHIPSKNPIGGLIEKIVISLKTKNKENFYNYTSNNEDKINNNEAGHKAIYLYSNDIRINFLSILLLFCILGLYFVFKG